VPDQALENTMLSALQTELEKIGTAPLSNWLTQTPPAIKLGVPGDKLPGPNLFTMWLQHLSTEFLDAEGGTATHRIRATFGVWFCSTHADDCMARALDLRTDILRTIFAAEGTFEGLFDGGQIWPGSYAFQGGDAYIRAGAWLGMQEVTIFATLDHDLSLLADPSMLSFQLERTLLRVYPFSTAPVVERNSGGFTTQTVEPPALILEATTQGANKITEARIEELLTGDFFLGPNGEHWSRYTQEIACWLSRGVAFTQTATMYVGIEIGSMGQNPPFPVNAVSGFPLAQLRWSFGNSRWELVSSTGDGINQIAIVPLTGLPAAATQNTGSRLRLLYDPFAPKLQAFVGGVLGAEITDPAKLPQFANGMTSPVFMGAFLTTGTSGGTVRTAFSACHCKTYNTTKPAATLWY
jgi:hypothetical protein